MAAQERGAFLNFITAVLADERTDTITEFKYRWGSSWHLLSCSPHTIDTMLHPRAGSVRQMLRCLQPRCQASMITWLPLRPADPPWSASERPTC